MPEDPDETTVVQLPAELFDEIRRTTRRLADDIAQLVEASAVQLITRAYTDGWAKGYLTCHNEPTREQQL